MVNDGLMWFFLGFCGNFILFNVNFGLKAFESQVFGKIFRSKVTKTQGPKGF
jgi:hypothetical protein